MALIQTFTVTVAATGTPQQLPSVPLVGQYIPSTLATPAGNTASINISISTTGAGAAATSFVMKAGTQVPVAVTNTNQLFIQGTAGDQISFIGA
jgi:hypothetical protein